MIIAIVAFLVGAGVGYGFRGSIRADIAKVIAAVKAEEVKLYGEVKAKL